MESVMKCNPWRWLWGLVPILMLGWIAILGERGRIESDLTSRAKTVLERSGYGWANVAFDGRDAVLTGRAGDEAEPPKAIAALMDTMGVRIVDSRAALIDKVDRYEWTAIRRDNRIRIDGLVPSDKTRRDVLGMVKASFPSLEVDDRMKLARGAPPLDTWLGGVGFGLKQLALLREGRVDLEQTSLSVSGDALDGRSYRTVKTALSGQMPQGIRLKSESVRPPLASPYVWSARRDGKEVQLAGYVPSEAARDRKPEACAAVRARDRGVRLHEWLEELRLRLLADANARVAHVEDRGGRIAPFALTYVDQNAPVVREFGGIGCQVHQALLQPERVCDKLISTRIDDQIARCAIVKSRRRDGFHDRAGYRARVYRLRSQDNLFGLDFR